MTMYFRESLTFIHKHEAVLPYTLLLFASYGLDLDAAT